MCALLQPLVFSLCHLQKHFLIRQIFLLTDSKAVLHLWIICVIYVLCLPCFCVCLLLPCGHLRERTDLLALVCDLYCDFVTFPFGILGQVWYLILSIPDPCCLSYCVGLCFSMRYLMSFLALQSSWGSVLKYRHYLANCLYLHDS